MLNIILNFPHIASNTN